MHTDVALHLSKKAVRTIGQGSGREILVNPDVHIGMLLNGWPTATAILDAIASFETALYGSVKGVLKARRGDVVVDRGDDTHADHPYYFTGHWTTGKGPNLRHGERRWVFSIADSNALRSAAGLSGGGPRSADYLSYPNEKFLEISWDEQQALIDRALGPDWSSLKAAIKPSAHDFGVVLPDLRAMLTESGNPRTFLKQIFKEARPKNIAGEIRGNSLRFLMWCFLAHLRR